MSGRDREGHDNRDDIIEKEAMQSDFLDFYIVFALKSDSIKGILR